MALVWFDSFDWYTSLPTRYDAIGTTGTGGSTQISAGVGGRATAGLAVSQGAGGIGPQEWNMYIQKDVTVTTTHVTIGGRMKVNTNSSSSITLLGFHEGATRQMEMWISAGVTNYDITLRRAGTVVATAVAAIQDVVEHFVEMECVLADSGTAKVYVDGVLVIDFAGDTLNGGTGVITSAYWGNPYGTNISYNFVFDDIYVNEGARLGDLQVTVLRPNAAGSETDFTPSAGANWQNVDDTSVHDTDTTYNTAEPSGSKDLFNLPAIGVVGNVLAIAQHLVARKSDAGEKTIDAIIKSGSVEDVQNYALTETYQVRTRFLHQDPDGDVDWDVAAIDALEVGYGIP